MLEREDIEAVIACLGDDAAQLRGDNPEDERADNMDRAATMLRELADSNAAVARLLLDQDREGAKGWARGIHLNMDSEGGLTAGVPTAQAPLEARKAASDALDACVREYLEGYELRGDGGDHTPTEFEAALIADAVAGLIGEDEFVRCLHAWDSLRTRPAGVTVRQPRELLRLAVECGGAELFDTVTMNEDALAKFAQRAAGVGIPQPDQGEK